MRLQAHFIVMKPLRGYGDCCRPQGPGRVTLYYQIKTLIRGGKQIWRCTRSGKTKTQPEAGSQWALKYTWAANEAKLSEPQKTQSLGTLYGSADTVDVPSTNNKTGFQSDPSDQTKGGWENVIIQNLSCLLWSLTITDEERNKQKDDPKNYWRGN